MPTIVLQIKIKRQEEMWEGASLRGLWTLAHDLAMT